MAAMGIWSVRAVTRNPSGSLVTASPCAIQTVSVTGKSWSSREPASTARVVAPYSR